MRVRSEARFSVSARMARHYHIWLLRAIRFMAQAPKEPNFISREYKTDINFKDVAIKNRARYKECCWLCVSLTD
jgi:hypothetical protein